MLVEFIALKMNEKMNKAANTAFSKSAEESIALNHGTVNFQRAHWTKSGPHRMTCLLMNSVSTD